MKKLYTKEKYKRINSLKIIKSHKKASTIIKVKQRALRLLRKSKQSKKISISSNRPTYTQVDSMPVFAPSNLKLFDNTEKCLLFFRELRSEEYIRRNGNQKYIVMSLRNVEIIDYAAISILTAINDELKYKNIILQTILPINEICKKFMIDSGYLNNLYDQKGKQFPKTKKSDLIFFEKGSGRLSEKDSMRISYLVKNIVKHLTGLERYSQPIRTIILEICGNSIEWSGTTNKQWLLGVKYEQDSVILTLTDIGKGILDTLYRKFTKKYFSDTFKSADEILNGAFEKKYGSNTREINRNKGLPAIKANFEAGNIKNLKVLTNNVILHFDTPQNSMELPKGFARFKGTFYQWEMSNNSFNQLI